MPTTTLKKFQSPLIGASVMTKPATLANIFCENRRPSRLEAKLLEAISGVSFEDWLLTNGSILRQKVFTAWAVRRGEGK